MSLTIYNSLTKSKEEFKPYSDKSVGMYACGMTVYDFAHIGHGRKYVGDDVMRRTLEYLGYEVNHVQNVTDVGHLVSDADEGEDKLEKGARKQNKSVWEVAEYFTDHFYTSMDHLNILRPNTIAKATEHIKEQIELVDKLITKGFAYDTPEAVYFDTSKLSDYGKLFGQSIEEKQQAVRDEVQTGNYKMNPVDFALWFKRVGRFENHAMHWDSPWGDGFPGWHIECSAMSMKYLGEQFEIHTGGEDHLPVHHPNEIAQSEAATGKKPFVKYWVHHAFLKVDNQKMSKSLGNYYTIEDVIEKGYEPLSLRYLYLTTHYRKKLNFTWEALTAAQTARHKLLDQVAAARQQTGRTVLSDEKNTKVQEFSMRFRDAISDDLNMPQALAIIWEVLKSNIPSEDKYDLALSFDEVLGLGLGRDIIVEKGLKVQEVEKEVQDLIDKREQLRKAKKFDEADKVRDEIEKRGYTIKDTAEGVEVKKIQII